MAGAGVRSAGPGRSVRVGEVAATSTTHGSSARRRADPASGADFGADRRGARCAAGMDGPGGGGATGTARRASLPVPGPASGPSSVPDSWPASEPNPRPTAGLAAAVSRNTRPQVAHEAGQPATAVSQRGQRPGGARNRTARASGPLNAPKMNQTMAARSRRNAIQPVSGALTERTAAIAKVKPSGTAS